MDDCLEGARKQTVIPGERRRYPRRFLDQPVVFSLGENPDHSKRMDWKLGRILNVSLGGLCIRCNEMESFQQGVRVEIYCLAGKEVLDDEPLVQIRGRIVWQDKKGGFGLAYL